MPYRTDRLVKNIVNDRNVEAKKDLDTILEKKIEKKIRKILTKNENPK